MLVVQDSLHTQIHRSSIITNQHTSSMHLKKANRENVRNATLNTTSNSLRLGSTSGKHDNLASIHNCLHTNSDGHCGNLGQVAVEEAGVRDNRLIVQALNASLGRERRSRLIEGKMTVGADAAEEKLDATKALDLIFVALTLGDQVRSIGVRDVDILSGDVDEVEEVLVHEGPVTLGVVLGEADVLVHVEGDDVLEGDGAFAVVLDEFLVGFDGGAAGGEAEDEGTVLGGLEFVDALDDEGSAVFSDLFVAVLDDDSHFFYFFKCYDDYV